MCLAIFKPAGYPISLGNLKRGWEANDDGAGYCFVDEYGDIIVKKFMTWDEFLSEYAPDVDAYGEDSPFLIHFRITSKGETSLENCHPFRVNDDMAIIHNGTMTNIKIQTGDKRSDTKIFAEEYLRNIGETLLDNEYIFKMAESFVGYSKVCVLHRTRGVFILNEEMGHWNSDGCWYSNKSYEAKTNVYQLPAQKNETLIGWKDTKAYTQPDSMYDYYYTRDSRSYHDAPMCKCEWCSTFEEKDLLVTVTNAYGYEVDICEKCYIDYCDMYDDILCAECSSSVVTDSYVIDELEEVVQLCDKCAEEWSKENDWSFRKCEEVR